MRRVTSIVSESLKAAGAVRAELSSTSATSARLRAGREPPPEKITSSMPEPRMSCRSFRPSPSAGLRRDWICHNRSADHASKARLDQEVGGFAKTLKSKKRRRWNFMTA